MDQKERHRIPRITAGAFLQTANYLWHPCGEYEWVEHPAHEVGMRTPDK